MLDEDGGGACVDAAVLYGALAGFGDFVGAFATGIEAETFGVS
jgi:hypothetical protein